MVQVDVFWSFGVGAGFAACATGMLRNDDKPFDHPAFIRTLLWLGIFFVPSGSILLWGFPAWETMQVGTYNSIPAWLVGVFCGTNITQGILGYWVTYKLIKAKKEYAGMLMVGLGYFLMFFILVHGWDGTGYQRFFYCAKDWSGNVTPWVPGTFKLYQPISWIFSPVSISLMIMGAVMMPFFTYWMIEMHDNGFPDRDIDKLVLIKLFMKFVFIYALGLAIVASILIHLLGWFFGIAVFAAIAYFILKKDGIVHGEVLKILPLEN